MIDYELAEPAEERDRNLNRFLQFCGLTYQMVSGRWMLIEQLEWEA